MQDQNTIYATVSAHIVRRMIVREEIAALTAELGEIETQIDALRQPQPATPTATVIGADLSQPATPTAQR